MNTFRNLLLVFFAAIGLTLAGCGGGALLLAHPGAAQSPLHPPMSRQ